MSKNPVKVAQLRKKEIMAELARIEEFLQMAEMYIDGDSGKKSSPTGSGSGGSGRTSSGPKPAQVIAATEKILGEATAPMTRGELLSSLKEIGLEITGTNPANTLGTTLSRNEDKFVNIKGFGYWLSVRDFPKGNYFARREDREEPGEAKGEPASVH